MLSPKAETYCFLCGKTRRKMCTSLGCLRRRGVHRRHAGLLGIHARPWQKEAEAFPRHFKHFCFSFSSDYCHLPLQLIAFRVRVCEEAPASKALTGLSTAGKDLHTFLNLARLALP